MDQTFMKEKPIFRLVLSMSLPMVLSMLISALYNIVDSYFVAKISEEAMTALSLVYPMQLLETAIAVGFGVGMNAVAAFHLGARQEDKANDAVSVSMVLTLVHGIVMTLLFLLLAPSFLSLFTEDAVILQYGITYSYIVFSFVIPYFISITLEKLFQAEGQMTVSMLCMSVGCVVNIILDPFLIFGIGPFPKLEVAGAAWATGIGQVASLLLYVILYFVKKQPLKIRFRKEMWNKNLCKRIYAVGIPATINLGLPSLLITALNGILAGISATAVLVLGAYYKLQTFIYLTANGIVQGIRPIVGYNYGAGEFKRVDKIFQTSLLMIASVMAVGTVLCLSASGSLIGLFTDNAETVQMGKTALRIICAGFIVSSVSVTASGVMEALGKGNMSLIISLMRYLVVIVPVAFLLSRFLGATGVWAAFPVAELLTALTSWLLYQKQIKAKLLHGIQKAAPRE